MRKTLFSIVMPAYNEQDVLPHTVPALIAELDRSGVDYELIVVNDGSDDRTVDVLARLDQAYSRLRCIDNPGPYGYGCAVRHGLENYRGDAVAIVMADGSDRPEDLVSYFAKIADGYDVAFGSRFDGEGPSGYPLIKRLFNRMGNGIIGWLIGSDYRDFTNGFKCYRREIITRIQPLISGQFNLTVEMSIKAVLVGAEMATVANGWSEREAGESKFRLFRLSWLYLLTVAYCLLQYHVSRAVSRGTKERGTEGA